MNKRSDISWHNLHETCVAQVYFQRQWKSPKLILIQGQIQRRCLWGGGGGGRPSMAAEREPRDPGAVPWWGSWGIAPIEGLEF